MPPIYRTAILLAALILVIGMGLDIAGLSMGWLAAPTHLSQLALIVVMLRPRESIRVVAPVVARFAFGVSLGVALLGTTGHTDDLKVIMVLRGLVWAGVDLLVLRVLAAPATERWFIERRVKRVLPGPEVRVGHPRA